MKKSVNFRLSEDAIKALASLAVKFGLSKTATLEIVIRHAAYGTHWVTKDDPDYPAMLSPTPRK